MLNSFKRNSVTDINQEDTKKRSSSGANSTTTSGYNTEEEDDFEEEDILNISSSILISNKIPKKQNYAIMFDLTDELLKYSHKISNIVEESIISSDEIEIFIFSKNEKLKKLKNALTKMMDLQSAQKFTKAMKYYEEYPVPLQKKMKRYLLMHLNLKIVK
eukprot:gene1317-11400_t